LAMNQAEGNTSEMGAFIIVGNSLAAPPVQQRSNPKRKAAVALVFVAVAALCSVTALG